MPECSVLSGREVSATALTLVEGSPTECVCVCVCVRVCVCERERERGGSRNLTEEA